MTDIKIYQLPIEESVSDPASEINVHQLPIETSVHDTASTVNIYQLPIETSIFTKLETKVYQCVLEVSASRKTNFVQVWVTM